ncbi:uncharacterized protein LOC128745910 [Sabethes cyaneus]|uniref:uncharacterized protein LOC128745910 n=1 Tax=Sabethes cyaneus TaxID=53552 RepID=UPI00237DF6D9|nr:uncharacterized protein LOC128745910 [Sabethes cyaneus]
MDGQHNLTGFNCKRCTLPDSADNHMVACDICQEWEHFKCAGVDERIADQPYQCQSCIAKQSTEKSVFLQPAAAEKKKSTKTSSKMGSKGKSKVPPTPSVNSITSSNRAAMEAHMRLIEEEQRMQEQQLLEQEKIRKQECEEEQRQIEEQRQLMEREKLLRERKLKESKAFQAQQQLIRQQSLEKKRGLMQQMSVSGSRIGSELDPKERTMDWMSNLKANDGPVCNAVEDKEVAHSGIVPPRARSVVEHPVEAPFHSQPQVNVAQQLAARQVMGRELPSFSGHPEDWPIFISSFEQSTAACGFTDAENLIRLQRSLKGHALESVRSRLLLPAGVPHVIKTLRILYGRPELLIRSLTEKIQRLPPPRHDRLATIMEFGLAVQNLVDHLKAAHQVSHLTNPVLMQELIEKLPEPLRLQWAMFKGQFPSVTLATFGDFMSGLVEAASEVTFELPCINNTPRGEKQKPKEKFFHQMHSTEQKFGKMPESAAVGKSQGSIGKLCPTCRVAGHRVNECVRFKSLSVEERWKIVQQKGLCRTCLNNHGKWPCKSWKGCAIDGCSDRHHTLLHPLPTVKISASHSSQGALHCPLFRILPVELFGNGVSITVFAFIDEGSSVTLLEETVATELGVAGRSEPLTLQWTGNMKREEPKSQQLQLEIAGKNCATRRQPFRARTVSSLVLPNQTIRYTDLARRYPHLRGLPLEDYGESQQKLLIGLDNLRLTVPLKRREGGNADPIATKCRLGWSIYGCGANSSDKTTSVYFHLSAISDADRELNEQLREYFSIEAAGTTIPVEKLESAEDRRARRILEESTRRTTSGFETALLWKADHRDFPDSLPMATQRLLSFERKLQKDSELKQRVNMQIKEYVKKGYAHKASEMELHSTKANQVWYLPLGVVVNPRKPEKLRLIWDAAAKVDGVSFNTTLLKGPDLLSRLPTVLFRFRQFPVAVCGDIRQMFHQIKIRESDRQSQRFLWRETSDEPPTVYVMDVATFGSTCSPTSAQYVKNLNAREFIDAFPRAVDAILNSHYVDDLLDSFRTVQEAVDVINQVKLVHTMGGFEIRNFLCNRLEVLSLIGEISDDGTKDLALEREGVTESVLGMRWIPADDCFTYTFMLRKDLLPILREEHIPTIREILKVVMSLFDPLGLLSFFLVHGKIIIQDCWATGITWDEPINAELYERWIRWTSFFPLLDTLRIPRCYFLPGLPTGNPNLQVHAFVDASEQAYCCVIYFRLEVNGSIQVSLVAAKTKVAPLKTLSIPKLELKAAVLGVRLMNTVINSHTLTFCRRYLWSDSTTVLAWIQSNHRRYQKFVAVQVGEILMVTEPQEWMWVPTKLNIADEGTKWRSDPNFRSDSPWFVGPCFLRTTEEHWPKQRRYTTTVEEIRPLLIHTSASPLLEVSRFGRWEKLNRTMAYVIRFIQNLHRKRNRLPLELEEIKQQEFQEAEEALWKMAQAEGFPSEIATLKPTQGSPQSRHAVVAKSSSIYKTWPFLDEKGILRKRGRIDAAPFVLFDAKYPIILPKGHPIVFLLIDWYHRHFRHANRETVVNEMRQRFEISKLREQIKKVMSQCNLCRIAKASPSHPPMASLPSSRLTPFVQPFTSVGVDYFGPIHAKVGRSDAKRWVALFTCLTIRAVHLEVVYSLSTESCILAVRRFVSRRGSPAEFYSDNGTCFTGASNLLQQEILERNRALVTKFTDAHTCWKFIPPATPHMGGVWERLVRSVKVAVGTLLDSPRVPDDETLLTIMCEAEAMINHRPLTSWKLAQYLRDEFWRRWIREYLPVINRRCKWFDEVEDIKVGNLVFVVSGASRNQWIRGRVLDVIRGRDGRVRQALVQTATGVVKRAAVNLAVLDVRENSESHHRHLEEPRPHQDSPAGDCDDEIPRCSAVADAHSCDQLDRPAIR